MNKNYKYLLWVSIPLLLAPLIFYVIRFHAGSVSDKTEDWAHFGDYLNGTFMPMIALSGVIATVALGIISENRNKANLEIEQQKQRPLLYIGYFDGEDEIRLFIKNKGNGPALVNKYLLKNKFTGQECNSVFDIIPPIGFDYNNFTGPLVNDVFSEKEEKELLLLKATEEELNDADFAAQFEHAIESLRNVLSQYLVIIEYSDVFGNVMPVYERDLEWFGRNND